MVTRNAGGAETLCNVYGQELKTPKVIDSIEHYPSP